MEGTEEKSEQATTWTTADELNFLRNLGSYKSDFAQGSKTDRRAPDMDALYRGYAKGFLRRAVFGRINVMEVLNFLKYYGVVVELTIRTEKKKGAQHGKG